MPKPKLLILSESLRRDVQEPLKYFDNFDVKHFFLKAPYGDYTKDAIEKDSLLQETSIETLQEDIAKFNPDIIQGGEPFGSKMAFKLANAVYKYCKDKNVKLIVPVYENRPLNKRFNLIQRIVLRIYVPRYFKRANLFFALNKGAIKNILSYNKKAFIREGVIWGVWGVNTDFFKPIALKKDKQIIYVGRFVEEKGIAYLLEGFRRSQEKINDLKLSFYGSGDFEDGIKNFVKENNLEQNIEIKGYADYKNLPKIFSEASLTIYPSISIPRWEEQVGTVNFQSLACSTPVISTYSGAIPEYLKDGEGAILVEERSAEAIGNAIEKYFSDRKYQQDLINKARKFVMRYDVKQMVAQAQSVLTRELYEKK